MNLRDKALLVQLNMGTWSARKHDKKASKKITKENNTKEGMARVSKILIAKESINEVQNKYNNIRQWVYSQARPWMESIWILKNENFDEFAKGLQERITAAEQALEEFLPLYPVLKKEAEEEMVGLGKMFNAEDYPDEYQIRNKFYVKIKYMPVPETDFRAKGLSGPDQEEIRRNIEESIRDGLAETMKKTYIEFGDLINNMIVRLDGFGKKNGKTHTFRDSLVENLQGMVDKLPKLNINDDPSLYAMGKEIEERLCKFSGDELRQDKKLRSYVKKEAEAIYKKMEGYF